MKGKQMGEKTTALPPHWLDGLYLEGSSLEETLNRLIEMNELIEAVESGIEEEAKPRPPKLVGFGPGQRLRKSIQEAVG